jgi:hypothetical protein
VDKRGMNSIFNLKGSGQEVVVLEVPSELEVAVKNDFNVKELRKSLDEHRKECNLVYDAIKGSRDSLDEFNLVINRMDERGRMLKPFNRCVVRALKYGNNKMINLLPVSKLLYKGLDKFSTQELVMKYCNFFGEQAEDFGELFYHVVERESSLVDYSKDLVGKNQFYLLKRKSLGELAEKSEKEKHVVIEKIRGCEDVSEAVKKALVGRVELRCGEVIESDNAVGRLVKENEMAMEEAQALMKWCSDMKGVLVFSKERMDNYAAHLQETLTTYLQAVSLNKGFRITGSSVEELANVMRVAQETADQGVEGVLNFIQSNGVYCKPLDFKRMF